MATTTSPFALLAEKLQRGEITPERFAADMEALQAPAKRDGAQCSRNSKGGLFYRHPSIQAWSTAKEKHYIPSVNLQWEVALALFGPDPTHRDAICKFVQDHAA